MKESIAKFKKYLESRYPGRSTTKHYMSDLTIFCQTVETSTPRNVTLKTIDAFVQAQHEQGLKPATINRRLSAIASFFDYFIIESEDDNWRNPVHWSRHSVRPGQHLPRDAHDDQVQKLMEVVNDKRDRAMFTLMVGAGLRIGEVVSIQIEDMDTSNTTHLGRLRVRGKGDKERVVWLTHEVMQHLHAWQEVRPKTTSAFLFLNQHQRPLTVSGVQFRLKQYCQKAGVKMTAPQLRHTFARRLVEQGLPVESLARLLGHNQLTTTQRYINGADPTLRADFLQAMAQSSPTIEPSATSPTPPSPVNRVAEPRLDAKTLLNELNHLAQGLPAWLTSQIRGHTLRRASRWSDHRLKAQLHHHFSALCRIGRWFVQQRHWQQLDGLNRVDMVAYVQARQEAGIKPQSIASELTRWRTFWRDLLATELVTNATLLYVKAPPAGDHLPRYLTTSQYQQLEDVVADATGQNRPQDSFNLTWFYLLAHAGLRISEVRNLRVHDCDLQAARLTVRAGKGNRDRVIPMSPCLVTTIQTYLAGREPCPTNHLLVYRGVAVKGSLIPDRLKRWGLSAEIVPLTPHRLRHTLATFLVNRGMPIVSLQKFLGHQDINKTLIYARIHDATVKEQFATAMAHIERIPADDWPTLLQNTDQIDPLLVDSV